MQATQQTYAQDNRALLERLRAARTTQRSCHSVVKAAERQVAALRAQLDVLLQVRCTQSLTENFDSFD
jgi:hypothetical protein